MQRAGNALSDELTDLTQSAKDYANYDRMYAYMLSHDPAFPEVEFGNLDGAPDELCRHFRLRRQAGFR